MLPNVNGLIKPGLSPSSVTRATLSLNATCLDSGALMVFDVPPTMYLLLLGRPHGCDQCPIFPLMGCSLFSDEIMSIDSNFSLRDVDDFFTANGKTYDAFCSSDNPFPDVSVYTRVYR